MRTKPRLETEVHGVTYEFDLKWNATAIASLSQRKIDRVDDLVIDVHIGGEPVEVAELAGFERHVIHTVLSDFLAAIYTFKADPPKPGTRSEQQSETESR